MKKSFLLVTVLGLGITTGLFLSGQRANAEGAAAAAPAKKEYKPVEKVTGDYAKITTLTADQEAKIIAVQKDAKIKIKKIEEETEAAVEALLNDAQKKELADIEKSQKEKAKEHAEKKKEGEKKDEKKDDKAAPAKAEPAKEKAK